jgi:hypothetical protein
LFLVFIFFVTGNKQAYKTYKVLDGLGFQREGLMRESWIGTDGHAADDVVLGLLKKKSV